MNADRTDAGPSNRTTRDRVSTRHPTHAAANPSRDRARSFTSTSGAAAFMRPRTVAAPAVNAFAHDVIRDPLPGGFDVATCSLFFHHLSDDDAVTVLGRMKAAATVVLVNDLSRSRLGFAAAWVGCRVLTRSRVVRFDGPASVRSAFTPSEALALSERAGLRGAAVARRWPFRFLLTWRAS